MKKGAFIAISITSCVACLGIGLVGGYFLYGLLAPEQEYTVDSNDLLSIKNRGDESEDYLETFASDPYNLANYAFVKFGESEKTLTLSSGLVENFSGDQEVKAATLFDGTTAFNQNISATSEGAMISVNTAFRFYDDLNGSITAYENKVAEDWTAESQPTGTYAYDEYIETFGKLNKNQYCVDEEGDYIDDEFTEGYVNINGAFIYEITESSVLNCIVKENSETYTITMELDPSYACYYYARQVKYTGGLDKNPTFTDTINVELTTDKELNLITSFVSETYTVTKVGVRVECEATMRTNYYSSNTDIVINNKTVSVPAMDEDFDFVIDMEGNFE